MLPGEGRGAGPLPPGEPEPWPRAPQLLNPLQPPAPLNLQRLSAAALELPPTPPSSDDPSSCRPARSDRSSSPSSSGSAASSRHHDGSTRFRTPQHSKKNESTVTQPPPHPAVWVERERGALEPAPPKPTAYPLEYHVEEDEPPVELYSRYLRQCVYVSCCCCAVDLCFDCMDIVT